MIDGFTGLVLHLSEQFCDIIRMREREKSVEAIRILIHMPKVRYNPPTCGLPLFCHIP